MTTTTLTYNSANSSNFTSDADVSFGASSATLGLAANNGLTFTEDFADDTGFTYTASEVEFASGLARQVDQIGTAIFGANYSSDINLTWRTDGGSSTATAVGSPSIVSGKVSCTGTNGLYYTETSAAQETIKFKYTPNYSGSPASDKDVIGTKAGSNADVAYLSHLSNGNISLMIIDNTVSNVGTNSFGAWSPTSGQEYEIELNIDSTNGNVYLFIDGVAFGSTWSPGTWARGGITVLYYVGAIGSSNNSADASWDDYIYYQSIQHTSNYTPGYSVPNDFYVETKVDLPQFAYTGAGSIQLLTSFSATEVNSPKYIVDSKYWNGSAWVSSDGTYAQASSSSDVNTNIGTLTPTADSVDVSVVFQEDSTLGSCSEVTVGYNGQAYATTDPSIIDNAGTLLDSITSITPDVTVVGSDQVGFVLNFSGQDYYYTTSWVVSNGTYAQSNTPAELIANASSLDVSNGGTLKVKAFLHSDDGSTAPSIASVVLEHGFFATQTEVDTCIVYGYVTDNGLDVQGASVRLYTPEAFLQGNNYVYYDKSFVTPANGLFELVAPVNAGITGASVYCDIEYERSNGKKIKKTYSLAVPDSTSVEFDDVATAI